MHPKRTRRASSAGTPKEAVGQRMREARKRRGKSQEQTAKELECTQPTVAAWESGRTLPRVEDLRRVARTYGMRPLDLIPTEAKQAA